MKKKLKIINKLGLHARASSKFVEITNKYKSEIFIEFNDIKVNAKSILGLLSLAISFNDEFEIFIEGEDESEALNEIINIVNNKFGEPE
ncbi:HPr family phosphocarrier protein [bacterium]|nr:HPr family phosphocarrier protein [bacterium]|tara:strand:+ start:165 stop:431 length:267 start_codon:yes stop_codon:yes gene_type:complete